MYEMIKLLGIIEMQHQEAQSALFRIYMLTIGTLIKRAYAQINFMLKTVKIYDKIIPPSISLSKDAAIKILATGHNHIGYIDEMVPSILATKNPELINDMWRIRAGIIYSRQLWSEKFNITQKVVQSS